VTPLAIDHRLVKWIRLRREGQETLGMSFQEVLQEEDLHLFHKDMRICHRHRRRSINGSDLLHLRLVITTETLNVIANHLGEQKAGTGRFLVEIWILSRIWNVVQGAGTHITRGLVEAAHLHAKRTRTIMVSIETCQT
jgi:histone H3/H4